MNEEIFQRLLGIQWTNKLLPYLKSPEFMQLGAFLAKQRKFKVVYPEYDDIFKAFIDVPFDKVKVVIIGQDPYHNKGAAIGRAFAVNNNAEFNNPSLCNIIKELESDLDDLFLLFDSELNSWAEQGVFLYNTSLTVEEAKPGSHSAMWKNFTIEVVKALSQLQNIVYILWGNHAKSFKPYIDLKNNCIIESTHPSPFSANSGFFGSKPFSKANEYLKSVGKEEIDWKKIKDFHS